MWPHFDSGRNEPTIGPVDGIDRQNTHGIGTMFYTNCGIATTEALQIRPTFAHQFAKFEGALAAEATLRDFEGKPGQTLLTFESAVPVLYVGLGEKKKFDKTGWTKALTTAFETVSGLKVVEVSVNLPKGIKHSEVAEFAAEVSITHTMCSYAFTLKTEEGGHKPKKGLKNINVQPAKKLGRKAVSAVDLAVHEGAAIGQAINLARDLVNQPANICTPSYLAYQAQEVEAMNDAVKVRVLGQEGCEAENMRAFLAVSKGSAEEPKFIHMTYAPKKAVKGIKLGIIGKGVTFDCGGLGIKNDSGMRDMQCDMAGAATMIAFMKAVALLELPIAVSGFAACCENMIGPKSYKPGDIIKSRSGRTILIGHTDAEGRVTMSDAIDYAKSQGVTHIVELSTLTGAIITAIGDDGAGMFCNDQDWGGKVASAALSVDEKVWWMPVWPRHFEQIKVPQADVVNIGGAGGGGASTAAAFLFTFADKTPFAHIDIAGTAWRSRKDGRYPANATGWGLLTLLALARKLAA